MSYFNYHVFFCTNQREKGRVCCASSAAGRLRDYAKSKIKSLNMSGKGQIRINTAGCLDRCEQGPVLVIYPNETWYTYIDESDIDEIIRLHLLEGKKVERLVIENSA